MVHGSPHNRPMLVHSSPQGAVPLVPTWMLPDGRIVYSNPGTPNQPVIFQAPTAHNLPPLQMPPGHIVMAQPPAQPPAQQVVTHTWPPNCAEHSSHKVEAPCPQCPPPSDKSSCTVPGCTKCPPTKPPAPHGAVVASATRMEAEHWVARILGFDMDYLRTLPPAEFQEKINVALAKAKEKRRDDSTTCPLHPHAHSVAACAPKTHAHRQETEEWLHRMLGIPRYLLRQWTNTQLHTFVNSTLAGFQGRN